MYLEMVRGVSFFLKATFKAFGMVQEGYATKTLEFNYLRSFVQSYISHIML